MIGQLTLLGLFLAVVVCACIVAFGPHGIYRRQKPDPWDNLLKDGEADRKTDPLGR